MSERDAIVSYLKQGGEYVRGVWYSWDNEMRGYAKSFAENIEANKHYTHVSPPLPHNGIEP